MTDSGFYRAFEDLHRGSRELIQSRQEVYLPLVVPASRMHPGAPVTDLGCGRGEWLELLERHGVPAQGVDLDEGMLAACRERGLRVQQGDALAFLRTLPAESQAAVTAFHVAEHLPFDVLQSLVAEILRVLRPGGLMILETPNPENLAVGTAGFYMDPTHERPLPSPLLAFLPQYVGFDRVATLRLNAGRRFDGPDAVTLVDVLAGVSPDYAVVAQKAEGDLQDPALAEIADAMSRDPGVGLSELALRLDRQWGERFQRVQISADAARAAASHLHLDAMSRVDGLEHRLVTQITSIHQQLHDLNVALADAHARLLAVHESRSWRVTRPLRWVSEQVLALRQQGVGERLRRLLRKLGSMFASNRSEEPVQAPPDDPMTPEAQEVLRALREAIGTTHASDRKP